MKTSCNPGAWLEVVGSFEIRTLDAGTVVIDRESLNTVTLDQLLQSFLEDPTSVITGPVRISVEPAGHHAAVHVAPVVPLRPFAVAAEVAG